MNYIYPHIGVLSRKSMKTLQAAVESQKNKMTAISFIETHFNRKGHELYLPLNQGGRSCARAQGAKSLDSDENFRPVDTLFCRKLRFVAIHALFGDLWTKKVPF